MRPLLLGMGSEGLLTLAFKDRVQNAQSFDIQTPALHYAMHCSCSCVVLVVYFGSSFFVPVYVCRTQDILCLTFSSPLPATQLPRTLLAARRLQCLRLFSAVFNGCLSMEARIVPQA